MLEASEGPTIEAAMWVDAILSSFYIFPVAVMAAHRLRRRPFMYISAGVRRRSWPQSGSGPSCSASRRGITADAAIAPSALSLLMTLGAVALGTRYARRRQSRLVMGQLFSQLSHTDQQDLIDLVRTLPSAGMDRAASL